MRAKILSTVVAVVVLWSLVLPLWAQESHDISLGGGLVARIRDKGTYPSLADRVRYIEQQLTEIISHKDTQKPVVNVKQVNGRWTIFAWDVALLSVFPAEAKANNLSEQQLAAIWARNLKERLPLATPCSKLPPEQLGYGKTPAAQPAAAAQPAVTPAQPATATPAQPAAAPVSAARLVAGTVPASGSESGALLLIVDALRTGRELPEQEWVEQKEALARNLYANLSYYLTGQGTPPTATPARPLTPVTVTQPAVPAATPATPAARPVAVPATPPTSGSADPSMAKVPQKNRIRAKFAAAQQPFQQLQAADPEAAQAVADMLAASRQAFAWGKFDESEQQADAALQALGVTYKE
jgi:hypothetical protein